MLARPDMRSLAWLALLPLLAACASSEPEDLPGDPGDGSQKAPPASSPPGDGTATSTPPSSTPPSGNACILQPKCDGAAAPALGAIRPFAHAFSKVVTASGPAFHRGRDQILAVGDAQWVIGKMTYSYIDKDLVDEEVDVWVERGCSGTWEKLGTTKTTNDGAHATVEGVEDSGGRVYFEIPKDKALAPGRHRIRLVVAGDQTSTDAILDIIPKGSPIVVSDVDGTLTESETAEYPALLSGSLPSAQPRAADALSTLAAKGYRIVYLTARPEWLTGRTHEFLKKEGFPLGVVHTTTGMTGALGGAAVAFKSAELAMLQGHGHRIDWAFGNKESDTDAYEAAKIPLDHRVFLRVDDAHGGRRIEAYSEIVPVVTALRATCQ